MRDVAVKIVLAVGAGLPFTAAAYTPACLVDQVLHTFTCKGSAKASGHLVESRVELAQKIFKQNPAAKRSCANLGPATSFILYVTDLNVSAGGNMGFLSRYGTQDPGPQGDAPDMDALLGGKPLNLKVYPLDYGQVVDAEDVTIALVSGVVRARVLMDVRSGSGDPGQPTLRIDQELSCMGR